MAKEKITESSKCCFVTKRYNLFPDFVKLCRRKGSDVTMCDSIYLNPAETRDRPSFIHNILMFILVISI